MVKKMPMYWDFSETDLGEKSTFENRENIRNELFHNIGGNGMEIDFLYLLTNWLYRTKIGNYCNRGNSIEQMCTIATLENKDVDLYIDGKDGFIKNFIITRKSEDEIAKLKAKYREITFRLIGMKVWANM